MKKCNLCQSENLRESVKESKLAPGVKYAACISCGNVMMSVDDVLIPTPQNDSNMTKLLIEDAAQAFGNLGGRGFLQAVSLNGVDMAPAMQPTLVKANIQEYINQFMESQEEEDEDELDAEFDCDEDCDNCFEGCPDFEEQKEAAVTAGKPIYREIKTNVASTDMGHIEESVEVEEMYIQSPYVKLNSVTYNNGSTPNDLPGEKKADYLIIDDLGKKHIFRDCSKDFVLGIINSAGARIEIFELKEIKLKEEVKYSF